VTRATTIDGFIEEAKKRLTDIQRDQGKSERATALRRIDRNKGKYVELIEPGLSHDVEKVIRDRLPRFYYFDDFSTLPGRLDPERLLTVPEEQLGRDERTAVSLMRMAGVVGKEFTDETFERRIAELEAAAAEIKQQVFTYWTQNRDLRIRLVSESELEKNRGGSPELKRMVDIRVEDVRHEMTTNLRRRSKGFQWFLSFIAGFSQFQGSDPPVVVLLDEPALGLHAQAQGDFLRFISERLGADNQVLYSTHSPFMVDPRQLAQVRVVEDQTTREDPDRGAKVFEDQLSVDSDTVFPLQAALGYDLAQHLFVGAATHVVVEGTSDYTFLQEVSEYLKSENRTGLSSNISVVPVGGIDKIPTFVALLGAHVDVAVLVDSRIHGSQKLATYAGRGLLSTERLVTVAEITGGQDGDIEDLFEPREYLALFNAAFGTNVQVKDMVGDDPIVRRLERHYGAYNHGRPASCLLRGDGLSVERLDEATLGRFESLLEKLNATVR
jgi:predicted ATP-dependent endonuclease of OLD family